MKIVHSSQLKVGSTDILKWILRFIILLALNCQPTTVNYLYGAFENVGVGARSIGMGGAFVGLSDSIYSIHYNPAGLCLLEGAELAGEGAMLYQGLDDGSNIGSNFAAFGFPVKREVSVGMNYYDLTLSDTYSEKIFKFSLGLPLKKKVYMGLSIKSLLQEYILNAYYDDDVVFGNGNTASTYDCDLGLLVYPLKNFSLGLSLINLLQGTYGLESDTSVKLSRTFTLGMAFHGRDMNFTLDTIHKSYNNISQDVSSSNEDLRFRAGLEKWLIRKKTREDNYTVALRAGLGWDISQLLAGSSNRDYKSVSAGFGFNFGRVGFDYGFVLPVSGIEETGGTHRFSFLVKFGKIYKKKAVITAEESLTDRVGSSKKQREKERRIRLQLLEEKEEKERLVEELEKQKKLIEKQARALATPLPESTEGDKRIRALLLDEKKEKEKLVKELEKQKKTDSRLAAG
jgi:hypothetical protein